MFQPLLLLLLLCLSQSVYATTGQLDFLTKAPFSIDDEMLAKGLEASGFDVRHLMGDYIDRFKVNLAQSLSPTLTTHRHKRGTSCETGNRHMFNLELVSLDASAAPEREGVGRGAYGRARRAFDGLGRPELLRLRGRGLLRLR